jgi:glycosyltransferase involved in cell wall biosynthesis
MSKKISIIIPVFNEEKNISLMHASLGEVFVAIPQYNFEVIFVDDGSSDDSFQMLEKISAMDSRIKFIEFSRNFGKEAATSAGLDMADGDAVIMIDSDLQHPVTLIPEFIQRWEQGAEVVVGVRNKSKSDSLVKKVGSFLFYKIMNAIGETKITPYATDFRLLDKKVVLAFRSFTEHHRMTRGLIDWLGFKRDYINFNANNRINGKASYNKIKLIRLAFSSFIAHSLFPLKVVGYLGMSITIFFGLFGFFIFVGKYIFENSFASSFTGPAQLAFLIIFLVGLIMVSVGLVALYIGNIKNEVADRPNYVMRKSNLS